MSIKIYTKKQNIKNADLIWIDIKTIDLIKYDHIYGFLYRSRST